MTDYSCTDELVDTYNLIDGHTFANTVINLALGAVIDMAAFFGATAGMELDINALPGGSVSYEIYGRNIQGELLWGLIDFNIGGRSVKAHGIPFDSAPGGSFPINAVSGTGASAQFFQDILAGNYLPCIEIHETQFGFVPTVSALNIPGKLLTPFAQIDPVTVVANNETQFDKVFILDPTLYPPNTAPTNEAHIDLTPSNVGPFEEFIGVDYYPSDGISILTGTTLNYGFNDSDPDDLIKTTDRILGSLTLSGTSSTGGGLCINCSGYLEIIDDNSFPVNTANNFEVKLFPDCSNYPGLLQIETNGVLRIGENSGKTGSLIVMDDSKIIVNDGLIEVRPNSKLIIDAGAELRLNGGLLRIQDGGEVIIKSGGKLIYEAGAQIELNGNDAVLSLGGLTHIGDDATFTFTWQGNESGYIRMLKEGYWGERFSAGINASVKLQGENKDDLILYMEENVNFWEFDGAVVGETYSSHIFERITFKYGKIIMEDNSRIVLINKSEFIHTTVESLHEGHHPRGVAPLTRCNISNSSFNRVPIKASLQYFESGPLSISYSDFKKSRIHVEGYGYFIQHSDFWFSPIFSEAGTVGNKIQYSTFTYESTVSDESFTDMFIYKSEFSDNDAAAVKGNGRLTLKCNTFQQNEKAIFGGKGAVINLSTLYSGGYNFFRQNDYNIELGNAFGLLMEDGYNRFYDGNIMNVTGSMDLSCNPQPQIIAYNNTWTPLTNTGVPFEDPNHPDEAEFDLSVGYWHNQQGWIVQCEIPFKFGPVAPVTECGRFDDPKDPIVIIEGPKSNGTESEFPMINSPVYFTDTPFDDAVKVAAFSTTTSDTLNGDDLIAADKFYELLSLAQIDSVSNDSIALVIEDMRWKSLNNYKATIERLFVDSILLRSNNQSSFDAVVQNYITVLMEFTDSVKTNDNYKEQFQLEMWKSSILSTIGKKEKALQILTNINYCDHDSLKRLILLESIQRLEFDLMSSQIDITTFIGDSITFVLDSSIYQIPLENYIDTTGFGSYIISPNTILFSSCNTASPRPSQLGLNDSGVNVVLYPNPTQNYLNISFLDKYPDVESILTLHIFELTGKEVFNAQLSPQNSRVNLPALANALYLYRLELDDKLIDQGKLSIIE